MGLAGLILMGGKNSRMGGRKKAFLMYHNRTFLDCMIDKLNGCDSIYLSVENKDHYQGMAYEMIEDAYPELGPMGGLYSALRELKEEAVLLVPCDMPILQPEIINRLIKTFEKEQTAVVISSNQFLNPLVAVYPKSVLPVVEAMILRKNYRMRDLFNQIPHSIVSLSSEEAESLANVNDPNSYNQIVYFPEQS